MKTNTFLPTLNRALMHAAICIALVVVAPVLADAQSISEIITDYNGYWKSGASNVNPVKPDNSHNLLAFTYNGVRYSTGVNDAVLSSNGQTFTPGEYRSLPVSSITGSATGNTKIGLGQLYDGVDNGSSNPAPQYSMVKYLTDGAKGLDLGTCVANLPAGDLFFPISNMQLTSIGDNIPDLVITQIADPSGAVDSYEFTDIFGNRVGNKVDILLSNLQVVGNWTADFYDYRNPMTLPGGFTKTDRPLRLWTADFSAFGINGSNIGQVAYFKIRLNGNSDVAFVAYNERAFTVESSILPITLSWFRGKVTNQQVELSWESQTEVNGNRFVIESSTDGIHFTAVDSVKATGMTPYTYSYTDHSPATGKSWYRLKQVDNDGSVQYSQLVTVTISISSNQPLITVYPNPTTNTLFIKQSTIGAARTYQVRNMQGVVVLQQTVAGSTQQAIHVQHLPTGLYTLVWNDGAAQKAVPFIKK